MFTIAWSSSRSNRPGTGNWSAAEEVAKGREGSTGYALKHIAVAAEGADVARTLDVISPTSATLARIAEALGADVRLVERRQPRSRARTAS